MDIIRFLTIPIIVSLQLIQESRMLFGSLSMPADHFQHVKLPEHEEQTKAPQCDAIEFILGIQELQCACRDGVWVYIPETPSRPVQQI